MVLGDENLRPPAKNLWECDLRSVNACFYGSNRSPPDVRATAAALGASASAKEEIDEPLLRRWTGCWRRSAMIEPGVRLRAQSRSAAPLKSRR
jgi:hypothetical protein